MCGCIYLIRIDILSNSMLEHLIHSSNPLCYTLSPYITRPYLNITNTVVQLDAYNALDFTRCLIVMLIITMNICGCCTYCYSYIVMSGLLCCHAGHGGIACNTRGCRHVLPDTPHMLIILRKMN